jgi:hypothetical protein
MACVSPGAGGVIGLAGSGGDVDVRVAIVANGPEEHDRAPGYPRVKDPGRCGPASVALGRWPVRVGAGKGEPFLAQGSATGKRWARTGSVLAFGQRAAWFAGPVPGRRRGGKWDDPIPRPAETLHPCV